MSSPAPASNPKCVGKKISVSTLASSFSTNSAASADPTTTTTSQVSVTGSSTSTDARVGILYIWNDRTDLYPQLISTGTAVLIAKDIILTAKKLCPWGDKDSWMKFVPYSAATVTPAECSFVTHYLAFEEDTDGLGFAICKLKDKLGDSATRGYMGVGSTNTDSFYNDRRWNSFGYHSASSPTTQIQHKNMRIVDMDLASNGARSIKVSPFSSKGWTGAPLCDPGNKYVVAVVTKNMDELPADTFPKYTFAAGGEPLGRLARYGSVEVNWAGWT